MGRRFRNAVGRWAAACAMICGLAAAAGASVDPLTEALALVETQALNRAIDDLARGASEPAARELDAWRRQLAPFASSLGELRQGLTQGDSASRQRAEDLVALKRRILLSNPLLKQFDQVLYVRRRITHPTLGLPANWEGNSSLPTTGWDNRIVVQPMRDWATAAQVLHQPEGGRFVGDLRLDFDGRRFLFSQPGRNGRFQVFEMTLLAGTPQELPLIDEPDVDNYDACYLPDGDLLFTSTAPFTGVPCVTGASHVSNLYRYERATGKIRRLTFDQEHNWGPVVLPSGRVMYLRWEYSDLPHFVARILFTMNPDGTSQAEHYGSGSYWPNSIFYAQPIPEHPTMFLGIVTGHHGVRRMGELVLFDPARGRFENQGVVQRIPGYGKPVKAILRDELVDASWPKFLHPCPLSEKYFLVSAQPTPRSAWGLYLVDVFDNLLLLKEESGAVLFEPVALKPRPTPPIIASRVKQGEKWATEFISDIYTGPGLKGVPRGAVKSLRLFSYHFAYHGMGGQANRVGMDGPWDIKRVLGTVPVEADGSAFFRIPAHTPISMQPLDAQGRALARMRSWTTAMPGEHQSCGGCHERQNDVPAARLTLAKAKPPADIQPWYGPVRGFSFNREIQPVLDRHCTGCHNGKQGQPAPDLTLRPSVVDDVSDPTTRNGSKFPPAYQALKAFVRSGPMESDMHLLPPGEFHASTTELVQLLERGHHHVNLDAEAWDRLITWIDLGTPAHGTWTDIVGPAAVENQRQRRLAMLTKYANVADDAETVYPISYPQTPAETAPAPVERAPAVEPPRVEGWPFGLPEAQRRQAEMSSRTRTVDLGGGVSLELVPIPAGEFVQGDGGAEPWRRAKVAKRFWMGRFEVSNEQYARFDPGHDSRLEHADFLHFAQDQRGYALNEPRQPVCRVSGLDAQAFCRWLSERTGLRFELPTDTQWEYACRAGAATPFWYGTDPNAFADKANLADLNFHRSKPAYVDAKGGPAIIPEWRPAVTCVNDRYRVSAPVGKYQPNAWGLHDMHGNVWEWTASRYVPSRDTGDTEERWQVCGGSWADRPQRATTGARLGYRPWQVVYNVGFRVVCED